MKTVCFEFIDQKHKNKEGKQVRLIPINRPRSNSELLLIAARCVQIISDREGLDKALEMLNHVLYKGSRISDKK